MLLDGFDLKIQNIPYFDQSVAYDLVMVWFGLKDLESELQT